MIVTTAPPGSRLVTQSDHARLAADLLRLFRVPELVEHPRRELLLRAVAEHDNGWWEADAAPRLDAKRVSALDFRDVAAVGFEEFFGETKARGDLGNRKHHQNCSSGRFREVQGGAGRCYFHRSFTSDHSARRLASASAR